jgi:hypothetical protein
MRIGSAFDSRLDPDQDPNPRGLKRAERMKKLSQRTDNQAKKYKM